MKDGSRFEDYGDANRGNTSTRVATALIRMASTRAKGRALRDAINVGQTMLEELPDLEEDRGRAPAPQYRNEAREPAGDGASLVCSEPGCGVVLNQGVAAFSQQNYNRLLCRAHQPARTKG